MLRSGVHRPQLRKQGLTYLRSRPGITKVVLLGHSGGGPSMTFYQAVAEKGVAFCQQPGKLIKCSNALAGLPPVDGVILMDAHPGNGVNAVRSISANVVNDAAILHDNSKPRQNPDLDPFDARNGYRPNIHHSTLQARKLVKNDGSVEGRFPVTSVRVASLASGDEQGFGTTMFLTVKSFLSVRAIRSTDSMNALDWCSSNNSTPCNLQQMTVPVLVTAMGGHYFIRDAEQYFDMAVSPDKDYYVIERATFPMKMKLGAAAMTCASLMWGRKRGRHRHHIRRVVRRCDALQPVRCARRHLRAERRFRRVDLGHQHRHDEYTLSFSAPSITRVVVTPGSFGDWVGVDNIQFIPGVPEPESHALMVLGPGALAVARRRSKSAQG